MINKKSNSLSAVYYPNKINLSQNWEISFMYELTGAADGFTFVMQSSVFIYNIYFIIILLVPFYTKRNRKVVRLFKYQLCNNLRI